MCDKLIVDTIQSKVESLKLEQCEKMDTQITQYQDDELPTVEDEHLQYQTYTTLNPQNNISPKEELLNV